MNIFIGLNNGRKERLKEEPLLLYNEDNLEKFKGLGDRLTGPYSRLLGSYLIAVTEDGLEYLEEYADAEDILKVDIKALDTSITTVSDLEYFELFEEDLEENGEDYTDALAMDLALRLKEDRVSFEEYLEDKGRFRKPVFFISGDIDYRDDYSN